MRLTETITTIKHYIYKCVCIYEAKWRVSYSIMSLWYPMDLPDSSVHGIHQAKIPFPSPCWSLTQGSNLGLLHCRWVLLPESPRSVLRSVLPGKNRTLSELLHVILKFWTERLNCQHWKKGGKNFPLCLLFFNQLMTKGWNALSKNTEDFVFT